MNKGREHKWGIRLISLLFAIVIWTVIVNVNDPEVTKVIANVPVTIINQEAIKENGKVFEVLENSNSVNITVHGRRSVVERLTSASFEPTANMEELTFMNTIQIEPNPKVAAIDVHNITCHPSNLKISLEDELSKRFVLKVERGTSQPDENFEVGQMTPETDSVIISGPKSTIDKLDKVVVMADVSGLKEDRVIEAPFKVFDKNGDEIDASTYDSLVFHNTTQNKTMALEIHLLRRKRVQVDVRTHNLPAEGYEIVGHKTTPELVGIVGEEEYLKDTEAIYVELTTDLSSAKKDVNTTVDINDFLPTGIKLAEGENEKIVVDTQIALINSWNFEVPVVSIKAENLDKDFQLTYPNEERILLPINRTQDNDRILQLKDVEVSVDFRNLKEGNYDLPINVKLPNGFLLESDEVTVNVTISKKE